MKTTKTLHIKPSSKNVWLIKNMTKRLTEKKINQTEKSYSSVFDIKKSADKAELNSQIGKAKALKIKSLTTISLVQPDG